MAIRCPSPFRELGINVAVQRDDWLELFPFLATRRPDSYAALTEPVRDEHRREVTS